MVSSVANVIIWCYHVILSSGMITHPFFIFPENFTHSVVSLTGDEYVGEFHEGLPTGVGQFFYSNGDREEVLMEAGVRHGR